MSLTDDQIREVAWATKSAEPGRDGYILPFTFARAIEAAVLAEQRTEQPQSEQPQGNLAVSSSGDVHGDTGREALRAMAEQWHDNNTLGGPDCEHRLLEIIAFEAGYRAGYRRPGAYGWMPIDIAAIGERLRTQDNRITADPLFAVQQKRRIYGVDPERCDSVVWLDETGDYREADADEAARLDANQETDGWYRTGYIDIWEFVTGCFTEQGCKDYIKVNGHNLKEPRIYAYGSYRNAEFIALRKWLMDSAPPTGAAEGAKESCNG